MNKASSKTVKRILIPIIASVIAIVLLVGVTYLYELSHIKEMNLVMFSSQDSQTEFYILGTIHGEHFNRKYNYSIANVQSVIDTVKPDILLVEIRQETYDNYGVLDGPFEMMYAWSYAEAEGIPARGIDWWHITEDTQTNSTNAERDDHIYENILTESAGYEKVLVLCGTTHRIEQSKRFLGNGYTEVKLQDKSDYFGNGSPEGFIYSATFRTLLEDKAEWSKTVMKDEITVGTAEGSKAREQWLQNAENMVVSIERMISGIVDANALYYS
jgi:hypothetical protein